MKLSFDKETVASVVFATVLTIGFSAGLAQAQSKGGNGNNGGSSGGYSGDSHDSGGSQNLSVKSRERTGYVLFINEKIPGPPRRYIPKKSKTIVGFDGDKKPCDAIYNQITRANMLVMVPRYNDCVKRGLDN